MKKPEFVRKKTEAQAQVDALPTMARKVIASLQGRGSVFTSASNKKGWLEDDELPGGFKFLHQFGKAGWIREAKWGDGSISRWYLTDAAEKVLRLVGRVKAAYSYDRRKVAVLKQKRREDTDQQEWALFDSKGERVLEWFGSEKPSDERVQKAEARVQFFKNKGAAFPFGPGLAAEKWLDSLPGGLGDKGPPEGVDPKQVEKGLKVEREHTDDPAIAREIVYDHLTEDPRYYDKLESIEKRSYNRQGLWFPPDFEYVGPGVRC